MFTSNKISRHFKHILIITILCVTQVGAKLEDYFKKAEDKADIHKIRNIDFIYLINLDQRPQKHQKCIDQLKPYGIYPYRFSAVNGWELSLEAINDIGVKFSKGMTGGMMGTYYPLDGDYSPRHEKINIIGRTYFSHCMSRGAIGIVLSHLSILQDAYESGYETIWVMEDDIELKENPNRLSELIDQLDTTVGSANWDILFTDQDTRGRDGKYVPCYGYVPRPNFHPKNKDQYYVKRDIDSTFRKVGARFGAYSMIIRRSGINKILDFMKTHKVFLPYDMEFYLPEGIKMYCLKQDLISSQIDALTDNAVPGYLENTRRID